MRRMKKTAATKKVLKLSKESLGVIAGSTLSITGTAATALFSCFDTCDKRSCNFICALALQAASAVPGCYTYTQNKANPSVGC
jgi:hypothetical protein